MVAVHTVETRENVTFSAVDSVTLTVADLCVDKTQSLAELGAVVQNLRPLLAAATSIMSLSSPATVAKPAPAL